MLNDVHAADLQNNTKSPPPLLSPPHPISSLRHCATARLTRRVLRGHTVWELCGVRVCT